MWIDRFVRCRKLLVRPKQQSASWTGWLVGRVGGVIGRRVASHRFLVIDVLDDVIVRVIAFVADALKGVFVVAAGVVGDDDFEGIGAIFVATEVALDFVPDLRTRATVRIVIDFNW